jgi:hypothetical protein
VRAWLKMSSMPVTKDEPDDDVNLDVSVNQILELVESQVTCALVVTFTFTFTFILTVAFT